MLKDRPFTETVIKLILPFILLVVLLLLAIFFIFIPMAEKHGMEDKKNSMKNLTQTAWSTLAYYHNLEQIGEISLKEAKEAAITQLRNTRYGQNKKNYFWIIDMRGATLMHPYIPKYEGVDLADLTDIDGKFFIKEFIHTAKKDGEGIVEYKWQINDDKDTIGTKVSHVKLFAQWGWIIGTGTYMEEVKLHTTSFISAILLTMFIIISSVTLIYVYILKGFILEEHKKKTSFEKLLMQDSKMKALLEAIPDMILRIDRDGVVLDIKDPIGFTPFIDPSEILDRKIIDAWPANIAKKVIGSIERVFVTEEHQILEFDVSGEASKTLKIESHFVLSGGDEILATFRDITKRKK